ncbi:MAG: hypothetical protein GX558_02405 [Clostridiales bacterium]|nr:hypothetical protein [Clostridiales bacterium]
MKKAYVPPHLEVIEFRFADHVAAASGNDCYWGGSGSWTHGYENCEEKKKPGTGGWIDLNG